MWLWKGGGSVFVRCLVDEIMGSVCSKTPNQRGVTKIIKVQEQSDLADVALQASVENSTITIYEDHCFTPRVVPSYSWLVSPPIDFDASAKLTDEKAKEDRASERINDVEYCNRRFVKYCQHSTTSLSPLNMKQSTWVWFCVFQVFYKVPSVSSLTRFDKCGSQEDQTCIRSHRLSQHKEVIVFILVSQLKTPQTAISISGGQGTVSR